MYSRLYYSRRLVEFIALQRKTKIFNILFATTFFVPILLVIIGSLHYNDCPVQPYIPKCLILGGIIIFFSHTAQLTNNILEMIASKRNSKKNDNFQSPYKFSRLVKILEGLGHLMVFIWLVLATVLAVSTEFVVVQSDDNTNKKTYCEKRCYEFLRIKPIIMWALILLVISIFAGTVIYGFIKPVSSNDSKNESFPIVEKN